MSEIGVVGVSIKQMQSLFAVLIFEASTECGWAVPICRRVQASVTIFG
jgi:hypothetical protein